MKVTLAALALVATTLMTSGCAQSCQDKAGHEWTDAQERAINNATSPDDPAMNRSIKDDFNDLNAYVAAKCG